MVLTTKQENVFLGAKDEYVCPNCSNAIDDCACVCSYCGEVEECDCAVGYYKATGG